MQSPDASAQPVESTPERPILAYAPAFFGLLATRLTDLIVDEGGRVAAARGVRTPTRCMSTMLTLLAGPKGVSELARDLGMSHVALIKIVRQLSELGFVETGEDPADRRRRPVSLTEDGVAAAREVEWFVGHLRTVYLDLFDEIGVNVHDAMRRMETALTARSFFARLDARTPARRA